MSTRLERKLPGLILICVATLMAVFIVKLILSYCDSI